MVDHKTKEQRNDLVGGGGRKRKREKREGKRIVGREDGGWAVRVINMQATHTQNCKKFSNEFKKSPIPPSKRHREGSGGGLENEVSCGGKTQNDNVYMNHCMHVQNCQKGKKNKFNKQGFYPYLYSVFTKLKSLILKESKTMRKWHWVLFHALSFSRVYNLPAP